MKRLVTILVLLMIIVAAAVGIGYWLLASKAKHLLTAEIRRQLHRESSVGAVALQLPLSVVISDLTIFEAAPRQREPFVTVRRIRVVPSVASLLAGRVVLQHVVLTQPTVRLERAADGRFNCGDLFGEAPVSRPAASGKQQPSRQGVEALPPALRLVVDDGRIEWVDRAVAGESATLRIRDVALRLTASPRGLSAVNVQSSCDAVVEAGGRAARFTGRGTYEHPVKDLQAEVRLQGLRVAAVAPYFGAAVRELLRQGVLDVAVDATAERNQLMATCQLRARDVVLADTARADSSIVASLVTGAVAGPGGEASLDLDVTGQLDQPKTWQVRLSGDLMRRVVQQAVTTGLSTALQKTGETAQDVASSAAQTADQIKERLKDTLKETVSELLGQPSRQQ